MEISIAGDPGSVFDLLRFGEVGEGDLTAT